jgi:hypothetical protein
MWVKVRLFASSMSDRLRYEAGKPDPDPNECNTGVTDTPRYRLGVAKPTRGVISTDPLQLVTDTRGQQNAELL